jgi:predicted ATPase
MSYNSLAERRMKIDSIMYHDQDSDWWLMRSEFSDLTLLVGVSGVGKTMILDAIWRLKMVATGKPADGAHWEVEFSTEGGDKYAWSGKCESTGSLQTRSDPQHPVPGEQTESSRFVYETLVKNGATLIDRHWSQIVFNGRETPKLSPFESALSLLKEEDAIRPAHDGFKRIIRSDSEGSQPGYGSASPEFDILWRNGAPFQSLLSAEMPTIRKAALVYQYHPAIFQQIKEKFIKVFDQVEDIRFELPPVPAARSDQSPLFLPPDYKYPLLKIKEKGVSPWIWFRNISSGMVKTFTHLSEMYLWPKGTVVLIDEFENSLGINCIDVLTEELQQGKGLQFIVTSHHPYIINSISPDHWKLVTRKGNTVSTHDVTDLHINPSSRQKAFLQLINLEQYREGIQPA